MHAEKAQVMAFSHAPRNDGRVCFVRLSVGRDAPLDWFTTGQDRHAARLGREE
jgi:hypothetical protein